MRKAEEKLEHKKTKRYRISLCITFLLNILCLSLPFAGQQAENGEYYSQTGIEMVMSLFVETEDRRYMAIGLFGILFCILPIIGFLAAAFDRHSQIKCIIGFLVSVVGIVCITFMLKMTLSLGAMFAIMLYLLSALISAMLAIFTLAIKQEEKQKA